MTTRAPLDSFESALLSELRDVVTERSATQPRRRKPVLVAAAAAATVAASVGAVVFGLGTGGPATAAAYSVSTQADGDIVVKIHRLEDAEGLERELRKHGIDANVTYDPDLFEVRVDADGNVIYSYNDPDGQSGTEFEKGGRSETREGSVESLPSGGVSSQAEPAKPGEPTPDDFMDPCGFNDEAPMTGEKVGDDYVFTIPADSSVRDKKLEITTSEAEDGGVGLMAGFQASDDMHCFLTQIG